MTLLIIGAIVQIEQKRKQSKLKTADVLQLKADTVSYEAAQHKWMNMKGSDCYG